MPPLKEATLYIYIYIYMYLYIRQAILSYLAVTCSGVQVHFQQHPVLNLLGGNP